MRFAFNVFREKFQRLKSPLHSFYLSTPNKSIFQPKSEFVV